jgi:hypothetical protein
VGGNAASFGWGGFGGIVPKVVVCLDGELATVPTLLGVALNDADVAGLVLTSCVITGAVSPDVVEMSGFVMTGVSLTGPVLQSC